LAGPKESTKVVNGLSPTLPAPTIDKATEIAESNVLPQTTKACITTTIMKCGRFITALVSQSQADATYIQTEKALQARKDYVTTFPNIKDMGDQYIKHRKDLRNQASKSLDEATDQLSKAFEVMFQQFVTNITVQESATPDAALVKRITLLEKSFLDSRKEQAQLVERVAGERRNHLKEMESMTKEVRSIKNDIAELLVQDEKSKTTCGNLKSSDKEIEKSYDNLTPSIEEIKKSCRDLQSSIDDNRKSLDDLKSSVQENSNSHKKQKASIEASKKSHDDLNKKVERSARSHDDLKLSVEDIRTKYSKIEDSVKEIGKQHQYTDSKLKDFIKEENLAEIKYKISSCASKADLKGIRKVLDEVKVNEQKITTDLEHQRLSDLEKLGKSLGERHCELQTLFDQMKLPNDDKKDKLNETELARLVHVEENFKKEQVAREELVAKLTNLVRQMDVAQGEKDQVEKHVRHFDQKVEGLESQLQLVQEQMMSLVQANKLSKHVKVEDSTRKSAELDATCQSLTVWRPATDKKLSNIDSTLEVFKRAINEVRVLQYRMMNSEVPKVQTITANMDANQSQSHPGLVKSSKPVQNTRPSLQPIDVDNYVLSPTSIESPVSSLGSSNTSMQRMAPMMMPVNTQIPPQVLTHPQPINSHPILHMNGLLQDVIRMYGSPSWLRAYIDQAINTAKTALDLIKSDARKLRLIEEEVTKFRSSLSLSPSSNSGSNDVLLGMINNVHHTANEAQTTANRALERCGTLEKSHADLNLRSKQQDAVQMSREGTSTPLIASVGMAELMPIRDNLDRVTARLTLMDNTVEQHTRQLDHLAAYHLSRGKVDVQTLLTRT